MSQVVPLIIYRSSAPNPTDDISIGIEVDSRCRVGKYTYVCTDNSLGAAVWELTINPLNDVLSVGNDAGTEQIKNLGNATDPQDAMTYGQFLNGLAGLTSYFFSSTNSDIATYESMPDLANYTSAAESNNGGVSVSTTPTSLGKFATNSGFPNVTKIPIGLFSAHVEVEKAAGSNNYATFFKLYKRNLAGTEALLVTSDYSSEVSANTRQQISVSAYISDPITLLATDRLVIEWYSVMNASTATITMYYDGTTNARFAMPVVAASSSLTQASQSQVEAAFDNTDQATPTTLEQTSVLTPFNTWWLVQKIKTWVRAGFTLTGALNFAPSVNLASGTNPALGGTASNNVTITGTTTIAGFDTVANGITRTVKFSGILQLTYNATSLILPTSANITTAVGDIAVFRSLGSGNWECIEYTRRDGTALVGGSSFTAASVATINTGTNNTEGATALNLEGSKYLTQYSQKTFTTASGTTTYTATLSPAITSYADGMEIKVRFTSAPTGSATLAFDAVGAKNLYLDATTQVGSGSFPAAFETTVRYVSSLNAGTGGWLITQFSWWTWIKTQVQTFAAQITFSVALRINTSNAASAILGVNGNGVLAFTDNASAVNRIELVNSTTGNGTTVRASGSDTNIALIVASKGTGALSLQIGSTTRLGIDSTGVLTFSAYAGAGTRITAVDSSGIMSAPYTTEVQYDSIQTADVTVSNTTTETIIYAASIGSHTITSGTNYVGRIRELINDFILSTKLVAAGPITFNIRMGPAATALASRSLLLTTGAETLVDNKTTFACNINAKVVSRTVAASSVIVSQMQVNAAGVITTTKNNNYLGSFTGVDLTVDNVLTISVVFGTADASNTLVSSIGYIGKLV